MATTLQELQAKRKELQATNPNATMLDAKSAISPAPIANAPVAGQAPAITPTTPVAPTAPTAPVSVHDNPNYQSSTTEQYNRNVLAQNQAKAAAKADTSQANPPVIIQQAEAATAQANAPVKTETPTAPVTPTEAKTETPTTQVTPTSTTKTPTTTTTTPAAPVVTPDSNNIYANLRTNTPIPDSVKSTPQYRDAQNRYNNFQKYASYDVNTLTTALGNGTILPGTSTWNDLMTDPVMGAKILQAKAFSNGKASDFSITTQNASDNIVANSPTVAGMFADGQITAEEWANATNTPEVKAKMADVEAKKNAYDALKAKYDDIETQVNAEFPGSPFADSIIADRRKSMFKELTIAGDTYNNALGTLTQLKSDAGNLFEMNMKLYQEQVQAQRQLEAEKRSQAFQQMQTIQNQAFQKEMAGTQFEQNLVMKNMDYANQDYMNSKQFEQDLNKLKVSNQYDMSKLGVANKMDIQKIVAQYNLNKDSDILKSKVDLLSKGFTSDQTDSIIRSATGNWKGATGTSLLSAPDGTIIPTRLSQTTNANGGKECAEYVNDITGIGLGSTWASKQAKIDSAITVPSVGDTAIWIPDPSNKTFAQYGHAGVITATDGKNVTIKSSNLGGDGAISTVTLPISEITKTGGFANSLIKGAKTSEYSDSDIELLSELANMDSSARNTALKAQGIPLSAVTDYMAKAKSGKIPPTESQKQSALGILSSIQGISELDWNDAVGKYDYSRAMGLQDAENARVLIDNMRDSAAINNLGILKGPMSDKDIAFIKNVSSKLDPLQSNAQFEKNIVEMYNISARKVGMPEISKLSDIQKERILPGKSTQSESNTGAGQIQSYGGYKLKTF